MKKCLVEMSGDGPTAVKAMANLLNDPVVKELSLSDEWHEEVMDPRITTKCIKGDQIVIGELIGNVRSFFSSLATRGGGGSANDKALTAALAALVGSKMEKGRRSAIHRILGVTHARVRSAVAARVGALDGDVKQFVFASKGTYKNK